MSLHPEHHVAPDATPLGLERAALVLCTHRWCDTPAPEDEMEFPTADDVPFPYESPYGVQRDLMSAILGALRQIRANDSDEQTLHHDRKSVPPAGGVVPNGYEYRAPIIMVESPT
ncbi:hypothetical protein THAOC_21941, partial [Thalassiosira oceanica]